MLKDTVTIMSIANLETQGKKQTFYLQAPFYSLVRWDCINLCVFQKMRERNLPRFLSVIRFFLSDLLKLATGKVTPTGLFHKCLLQTGWRDELKHFTPRCGSASISFPNPNVHSTVYYQPVYRSLVNICSGLMLISQYTQFSGFIFIFKD